MGDKNILKKLTRHRLAAVGGIIIVFLLLVSLIAPIIAPHDPTAINLERRFEGPTWDYPMGTDYIGRCVFSRLIYGTRISLYMSFVASVIAVIVGFAIGMVSGLAGGKLDSLIMRILDCILAFPSLVLSLVIAGLMGPSLESVIIGVAAVWWAGYARLIRGMVLSAKQKEFVEGGKVVGTKGFKLVRYYIMPQVLPPILVLASLEMGWIILSLSGLSFLGLGAQPPTPEWGAMLSDARLFIQTAPHLMLAPGFAISLAVAGFNLLGEGLKEVIQVREMTRW